MASRAYLMSFCRVAKRAGSSMMALNTFAPTTPMPGIFRNRAISGN